MQSNRMANQLCLTLGVYRFEASLRCWHQISAWDWDPARNLYTLPETQQLRCHIIHHDINFIDTQYRVSHNTSWCQLLHITRHNTCPLLHITCHNTVMVSRHHSKYQEKAVVKEVWSQVRDSFTQKYEEKKCSEKDSQGETMSMSKFTCISCSPHELHIVKKPMLLHQCHHGA